MGQSIFRTKPTSPEQEGLSRTGTGSQGGKGAASGLASLDSNTQLVEAARYLNTTQPLDTTAGMVRVNGEDLTWRGATANQTAKKKGDEVASFIRPVSLREIMQSNGAVGILEPTRNAQGNWSLNRTAGGTETLRFAVKVPGRIDTAGRGYKLTKVHVLYELGVVNATSVGLLVDQVTYAHGADPVVAPHGGAIADANYDANHNTAAKRADSTVPNGEHALTLTLPSPVYNNTAFREVVVELVVVLANTGSFKLRSIELEYAISLE